MARPAKYRPAPLDSTRIPPLGPQIAKIRRTRGFTQYTLADAMGVSRKQITDYERGIALPNSDMVIRLALALRVSADTLLGLKHGGFSGQLPNTRFSRRLLAIQQLPEMKKRTLVKIIDEFIRDR
jgi:transcriptional regulator with XRE-family HTH domain